MEKVKLLLCGGAPLEGRIQTVGQDDLNKEQCWHV